MGFYFPKVKNPVTFTTFIPYLLFIFLVKIVTKVSFDKSLQFVIKKFSVSAHKVAFNVEFISLVVKLKSKGTF